MNPVLMNICSVHEFLNTQDMPSHAIAVTVFTRTRRFRSRKIAYREDLPTQWLEDGGRASALLHES